MKIRFLILIFLFFNLNSCAYFEEEEDKILPGKRESIFSNEDEVIVKTNKKIIIGEPFSIYSWNQEYQNTRNHLFHFKSKPNLKLLKRIDLGDLNFENIEYIVSPVINGNVIFYSDSNFNIYAKNLENGKTIWKIKLSNEKFENFSFVGGLSLDEKFLYITTGLGNVYCIDILKAKIEWTKSFLIQFSRPPLVFGNKVFIVSDDNQTFALNKLNGETIWSHIGNIEEISIIGGSKPIIDKNILIVTYSSGEIYALNENDGSTIWFDNLSSSSFFVKSNVNDIQAPATIEKDNVYVPSFSDKLMVYDLKTGREKWDIKVSSINPLVISAETMFLLDTSGKLLCLDKTDGKLLWAVQLRISKKGEEINWYGPLLSTNKLLVVSSDGLVLSLSPFTGKILSKTKFDERILTNPFQVKENIFLISEEGTLFILG